MRVFQVPNQRIEGTYVQIMTFLTEIVETAISEQIWIRKKYVLLSGSLEEQLLLTMKSAALRPKSQLSQQRRRTLSSRLHHSTMARLSKVCRKTMFFIFPSTKLM